MEESVEWKTGLRSQSETLKPAFVPSFKKNKLKKPSERP